ncbi:MAG TPA: PAS domain-containing protein, partial [Dissulfurispiraceae bacterium]|nr:PAS domain-containing protein [Dissulfurispiraceae bacterium]
ARLTEATGRLAAGDFDVSLGQAGTRELDLLAASIDKMRQDLKQYVSKLRQSEALLSKSQQIGHIGSWELDLVADMLTWSDEVYRIFGVHPGEFTPSVATFLEAVHPDDREAVNAAYSESVSEGRDTYQIEHRLVRGDNGEVRFVIEKCEHFKEDTGGIVRSVGMVQDITERKRAEEALRQSEALLRKSQEIGHIGSWERDLVANRLTWSDEVYRIFGVVPGEFTPSVEAFFEAVHPDDREAVNAVYSESVREGRDIFEIEHRLVRGDNGEIRFVLEKCEHVKDAEGSIVRSVGMVQDITERKMAEDALRASLEEKTVLLKEIHHRVKNNLQIVSSLLNLQADQEKNEAALAALRDTQNRVRSMAMLHEMLYRTESLARVDFASYIEGLCAQLFHALSADPHRVRLDCRAAAVELGLDHAVPCGLLVNELVSNAIEHAFPEGRAGSITVELCRRADDRLVLTVADDGIGLPAGLDISHTSTLGLQLVRILTTQLKGTLDVKRGKGTAFHVTFPRR